MSAAGPLLLAGGTLISAYGKYQAGQDQSAAYDENAQTARYNAEEALKQGAAQERQVRIMGRKALGDLRAGYGASGVEGGSALDVLADSAANVERDVHNVREEANNKYTNYQRQAESYITAGSAARRAGTISAVGELIKGGGYMAGAS